MYFSYFHQANTTVFTILSVIKRTSFGLSSTIIGKVSLFGYVIYSSGDTHCWQYMPPAE